MYVSVSNKICVKYVHMEWSSNNHRSCGPSITDLRHVSYHSFEWSLSVPQEEESNKSHNLCEELTRIGQHLVLRSWGWVSGPDGGAAGPEGWWAGNPRSSCALQSENDVGGHECWGCHESNLLFQSFPRLCMVPGYSSPISPKTLSEVASQEATKWRAIRLCSIWVYYWQLYIFFHQKRCRRIT